MQRRTHSNGDHEDISRDHDSQGMEDKIEARKISPVDSILKTLHRLQQSFWETDQLQTATALAPLAWLVSLSLPERKVHKSL